MDLDMARHKRSKQIRSLEKFTEDAEAVNKLYNQYMFDLQPNSPHYSALRVAQDGLWQAVRSVTGKDKMPWDRWHST